MFLNDKKKAVSVILSKVRPDGSESESEVAEEAKEGGEYEAFAEDLLAAIESKSVQSLAQVLRSFHEMIEEQDEEEDLEKFVER